MANKVLRYRVIVAEADKESPQGFASHTAKFNDFRSALDFASDSFAKDVSRIIKIFRDTFTIDGEMVDTFEVSNVNLPLG